MLFLSLLLIIQAAERRRVWREREREHDVKVDVQRIHIACPPELHKARRLLHDLLLLRQQQKNRGTRKNEETLEHKHRPNYWPTKGGQHTRQGIFGPQPIMVAHPVKPSASFRNPSRLGLPEITVKKIFVELINDLKKNHREEFLAAIRKKGILHRCVLKQKKNSTSREIIPGLQVS